MTPIRLVLAIALVIAGSPAAADPDSKQEQAGKHFSRGVTLFNEADYRAALVEFRRAYEIAPAATVLYNIGQTYYQLQNYAAALSHLERYLKEAGSNASRRTEVEQTLDTLRSRVGKVEISINVPDAELAIDDEVVGKAPLADPVLVSIGRRKVTATVPGKPPETRFVDVAAGDTVQARFTLVAPAQPGEPKRDEPSVPFEQKPKSSNTLLVAWTTTGILGAGAITMGVLAWRASKDLDDARGTFGVSASDLESKATRVKWMSITGDVLGVAAIVTGVISLKLTLSRSKSHEVSAGIGPQGVLVGGTFK